MSRIEDFREWYTELWSLYQPCCLPDELAFSDEPVKLLEANRMLRDARLSTETGVEFGVFQILGPEEARRAATIWSPVIRRITQEVSMAFHLVESQRQAGEIVSERNVARLLETLLAYFRSIGRPKKKDFLKTQIEKYLAEQSAADPDLISPTRLPVTINVPLLDKLRLVETELKGRFVDAHGQPAGLHRLGLGLDEKLDDHRYGHCTPLNCRTFAGTGGDGHHFSFLVIDGVISESSPIVATAPDNFGNPSAVVAESLQDFLRMGCLHGYGPLGHLAHQPDEELIKYFDPEDRAKKFSHLDFERRMLAYLRERLSLQPWTDWKQLRETQGKYKNILRHPPDAIF